MWKLPYLLQSSIRQRVHSQSPSDKLCKAADVTGIGEKCIGEHTLCKCTNVNDQMTAWQRNPQSLE